MTLASTKGTGETRIVKTVCNACITRCGLNVYVKDGKIIKVAGMQEHPYNRLCVKGYAIPELVHSSERLTSPLKKVDSEFKEVSWDEAFDFIAGKLIDIKEKYGAKAVVVHGGNPFIATQTEKVLRRFTDLYGTPNYTTGGSFCNAARIMGHALTSGPMTYPYYSSETRCMVVWGSNPREAWPLRAEDIYALRGRGAKLIVVDPKAIPLAKEADIHAQIRPGTDCALALGLLNVIIAEGLYDKAFVEEWTVGFDKLAEHVKDYSPERVEDITWVPAEIVRNMAQTYATNRPAATYLGISTDHSTNGIQAIRAIVTLIAVTGNLDIPGGNTYTPGLRQTNLMVRERVSKDRPVDADYPLYSEINFEDTVTPAIEQMITEKPYPIKGLLISGCNAVVTWPNTNKVKKAFEKLDLLLVVDIFMTDTAKMAHIVLPGTTFLERQDLRDYRQCGFASLVLANRVIEPVGNSMEDWKIWAELGKRMGYTEYFLWKDTDELIEYLLKLPAERNPNITLERLKKNPGGVYYAEREYQKYLKRGLNTPSKKVEIYSERMKSHGYDPLPTFHEPAESLLSRPDLAERYPLILITGARTIAYLHSEYRNLPSLRRLVPEPLIEIHPQTASSLGIADGDIVKVESLRGSIRIKAKLTEDIHPQVVSAQHGWSGEDNINYLSDDVERDPVSGYPGFRSILCRVTKAE